jgi:VWFA-related protein
MLPASLHRLIVATLLGLVCAIQATAQGNEPPPVLRRTSRAVLVDVIVTDHDGKPATGLKRDAFAVTEQGKAQTISFFEEHGSAPLAQRVEMPKLPPDVFTNFSPFPQPPAVNVLLLDSLNTRMESQSYVHSQALKFLKSAKPGTRCAIFAMGLELHFIQGFNDDPAVLAAALDNKRNLEVEPAETLKSQAETNAETFIDPRFVAENDESRTVDRELRTLANLQRLAVFLQGFPGRKNIIWFAEKVPGGFVVENGAAISSPIVDDEIKKTYAMLGEARAAIYPVDARGVSVNAQYTAENKPKVISTDGGAIRAEDQERNSDQIDEQIVAEQSGGRTFANTNGLSDLIDKITSNSSYFYTLSYMPANTKMDGGWRKIGVKVAGGRYSLSYRRGYFAVDTDLPGSAISNRNQEAKKPAAQNAAAVDPLLPFMDLGMPESEQILYKTRIVPADAPANVTTDKKEKNHYAVDFAIDLSDLDLNLDKDGLHRGALNISLLVYDRYRNIISREDHLAELSIKPDIYAVYQNTGVQLHAELVVPRGNYWLRTGIYDRGSHKVGTMEIPLAAVKPLESVAK